MEDKPLGEARGYDARSRATYVAGAGVAVAAAVGISFFLGAWAPSGFYRIGRMLGVTGLTFLLMQAALASRLGGLDMAFGLPRVMLAHRMLGMAAVGMLIAHPLALAFSGYGARLFSISAPMEVNVGKAALGLLVAGGAAMAAAKFIRVLDYNRMRTAHGFMVVPAALLAVAHGSAVTESTAVKVVCIVFFAAGAGLAYMRATSLLGRRRFEVTGVEPANHNTWSLELTPGSSAPFEYLPGQFVFLKLLRKKGRSEEHPFTVSSTPTRIGKIFVTVKESGNYTAGIGKTRPGDAALVEGPFGRFSYRFEEPESFIFIAAGVGITPIMSMIRHLRDTRDKRAATLLYQNSTEEDILFREELDKLPPNFRVHHVLSRPDKLSNIEPQRVDEDLLREHAGSLLADGTAYLCGPPGWMKRVRGSLGALGVESGRIRSEEFSL